MLATLLLSASMMFQSPNYCDTWAERKPYDMCVYVDFWNAFCGLPKGNVIPYRVWIDGVQRDDLGDLNRQKLVQVELMYQWPSSKGLVLYALSHPVYFTTPGLHTIRVDYSDQSVSIKVNGITSLLDGYGNPYQCPKWKQE